MASTGETMNNSYNNNFIDTLSVMSFVIGLMNYDENLSQSDKDDMIHQMNVKMQELLERLEDDLEEQNKMLREIIQLLKED